MTDKQENIAAAAIGAVFFLLVVLLSGCARTSATDSVLESVKEQTAALEKTLPKECQTDAVMAQIAAIRATTNAVSASCNSEKATLEQSRDKWKLGFVLLAVALVIGLLRKVGKTCKLL